MISRLTFDKLIIVNYKNNFKNGPHIIYFAPNALGEKKVALGFPTAKYIFVEKVA